MDEYIEGKVKEFEDDLHVYLTKCKDVSDDATSKLRDKLEKYKKTAIDTFILCPGTSSMEWDANINGEFGLDGRTVLVPVAIPKSIILSMEIKKCIKEFEKSDTNFSIDKQLQEMAYFIFMKGVSAIIEESEKTKPLIMMHMLEKMMRRKLRGLEDADEDDD